MPSISNRFSIIFFALALAASPALAVESSKEAPPASPAAVLVVTPGIQAGIQGLLPALDPARAVTPDGLVGVLLSLKTSETIESRTAAWLVIRAVVGNLTGEEQSVLPELAGAVSRLRQAARTDDRISLQIKAFRGLVAGAAKAARASSGASKQLASLAQGESPAETRFDGASAPLRPKTVDFHDAFHVLENMRIRDAFVDDAGTALGGPSNGWRSVWSRGFVEGIRTKRAYAAALNGLAREQALGRLPAELDWTPLGIASKARPQDVLEQATWIALEGRRDWSSERRASGDFFRKVFGHIGARRSSIYTPAAVAEALLKNPPALRAYLWWHAVELAAKRAARASNVCWTPNLAKAVQERFAAPQALSLAPDLASLLERAPATKQPARRPWWNPEARWNLEIFFQHNAEMAGAWLGLVVAAPLLGAALNGAWGVGAVVQSRWVYLPLDVWLEPSFTFGPGVVAGFVSLWILHPLGHYAFARLAGSRPPGRLLDHMNFHKDMPLDPKNKAQEFFGLLGGPAANLLTGLALLAGLLVDFDHRTRSFWCFWLFMFASVHLLMGFGALLPIRRGRGGHKLLEVWREWRSERRAAQTGSPKARNNAGSGMGLRRLQPRP